MAMGQQLTSRTRTVFAGAKKFDAWHWYTVHGYKLLSYKRGLRVVLVAGLILRHAAFL